MRSVLPPALERLMKNIGRLPGVGEKTAMRFALQILRWPEAKARELANSIAELHQKIKLCSLCFAFSEDNLCPVCSDPRREQDIICIVEDPGDMLAIEQSGAFKGRYHVLHGVIAPMDGIGPEQLRIGELIGRISREGIREVIIATSSTAAGEATAAYLSSILEKAGTGVTRIACGIPMGMDIKYADAMTLKRALLARRQVRTNS
ncbi:MAG: recombination mediator RecR [Dissulfurimicrobium sp.]|uniref:recombination mediator RecR n=1 Tax=Dissulfurimicrobium sp. TaxID=2022436 RepID=UPI00404B4D76